MVEAVDRIKELEQLITEANAAYADGNPIMSDYQYDMLVEELKQLNPESEVLKQVWNTEGRVLTETDRLLALYPMKSIEPAFNLSKLYSWVSQFTDEELVASLKADGFSFRALYYHGQLVEASTRGRRGKGNDITHHAGLLLPKHLEQVKNIELFELRGEMVLPFDNFIKLRDKYPNMLFNNPRNSVASLLKESALDEDIVLLKPVVYNYYATEMQDSLAERLDFVKQMGLSVTPYLKFSFKDEPTPNDRLELLRTIVRYFGEEIKDKCGYLTDGVVVSVDSFDRFIEMGGDDKYNEGARALKIEHWASKTYRSRIIDIEWSYGAAYITPVAIIEPVETESGRVVERVSLKNIDIMQKARAYPGNFIEFEYVSDINPKLIVYGEDDSN